jgi:UDP:flavonoid glycosyltransferase YjiC (YdhE family)
MRVLLSTYGSRGDVEPLVGLEVQLRALGAEGCYAVVVTGATLAGVWR